MMTSEALLDDFLRYLEAERHYSVKTVGSYADGIGRFVAYFEADGSSLDWSALESNDVRRWVAEMVYEGYSAATVNLWLSALRSFFRFLLKQGRVSRDPVRMVQGPKRAKPLPKFVRESEMNRLLDDEMFPDTFDGLRDKLILTMFYTTGMRLAELVGMDVADVDLGAKTLRVTGKRNRQRVIPIGLELEEAIGRYLPARLAALNGMDLSALFIYINNKGTRAKGVAKRVPRAVVERVVNDYLGLVTTQTKRSPHVLRHSFATAMLNHGAEIEVVKQILGHKSIATTEIYTHTTFEELRAAYEKAHPRGDTGATDGETTH